MSYNGSGVYSLPAGSTVTNGDTSDATDINTPLADLETAQNYARPVVAGGTGASTASAARDNLLVSGKILSKSSTYTVLAADRAKTIRCTAALTLDLTAAATVGDGWFIHVLADGGAVTVDPNGSETIDGATTLSVPDGNSCTVVCDGTSFYSMFLDSQASGYLTAANNLSDVDNASTARTNLGVAIGTDVQAYDALLASLAGQTTAANKIQGYSASDTGQLFDFLDEDNMASDSATAIPSQQSVKAYVDSQSTGGWTKIGVEQPTSDDATVSHTGISGYRLVKGYGVFQCNTNSVTVSFQGRASAGTWRTFATLTTVPDSEAHIFDFKITDFDGAEGNDMKVCRLTYSNTQADIDRSSAVDEASGSSVVSYVSHSEAWAEVRISVSAGGFEGTTADARTYFALEGHA